MDGYISHSFGPQSAERHFSHILKSNAISTSYRVGPDGSSFIVNLPDQYSRVIDRRVLSIGTVVPQILWVPHTATERRQHVQDAQLQMPIYFLHTDGRLGLTLEAAVGGRCHTLLDSQLSAPLGPQNTTYIRVGVSEHFPQYFRKFPITDEISRLSCSGVGITSSSDRYKSAMTKRPSAIPLLYPSSRNSSGDLWMLFSRTVSRILRTRSRDGVSGKGVSSPTKSWSLVLSRSRQAVGCRSCKSPVISSDDIRAVLLPFSFPYTT